MNTNVLSHPVETETAPSFSRRVTRTMLRLRAIEVAIKNGRAAHQVVKSDWEQANRELNDHAGDANQSALETALETDRWNPLPGSRGHKAPVNPSADEDVEGRSEHERLVDQGMVVAEMDRMQQAGGKRDQNDND
jgi:hypothetical protein